MDCGAEFSKCPGVGGRRNYLWSFSRKLIRVFWLKAGNLRAAASIYSNQKNTERLHEAGLCKWGMVGHIYNPDTQEMKAGGLEVQGHQLHRKFETISGYRRWYLKSKQNTHTHHHTHTCTHTTHTNTLNICTCIHIQLYRYLIHIHTYHMHIYHTCKIYKHIYFCWYTYIYTYDICTHCTYMHTHAILYHTCHNTCIAHAYTTQMYLYTSTYTTYIHTHTHHVTHTPHIYHTIHITHTYVYTPLTHTISHTHYTHIPHHTYIPYMYIYYTHHTYTTDMYITWTYNTNAHTDKYTPHTHYIHYTHTTPTSYYTHYIHHAHTTPTSNYTHYTHIPHPHHVHTHKHKFKYYSYHTSTHTQYTYTITHTHQQTTGHILLLGLFTLVSVNYMMIPCQPLPGLCFWSTEQLGVHSWHRERSGQSSVPSVTAATSSGHQNSQTPSGLRLEPDDQK